MAALAPDTIPTLAICATTATEPACTTTWAQQWLWRCGSSALVVRWASRTGYGPYSTRLHEQTSAHQFSVESAVDCRWLASGVLCVGDLPVKKTEAQLVLETHIRELGWYCQSEFQFCPPRKWRADYAIQRLNKMKNAYTYVLVEIEGGLFMSGTGRHNRGAGMRNDTPRSAQSTSRSRFTRPRVDRS